MLVIIILSLALTAFAYMAFPVLRLILNGGKFEEKKAKKIALWNAIVVGAIFLIATTEEGGTWSGGAAILYYFINRALLTDKTPPVKVAQTNKSSSEQTMQLNKLSSEKDHPINKDVYVAGLAEHLREQGKWKEAQQLEEEYNSSNSK